VSDKTPLKFDYDDTTPSSLAEFTAGNTVPLLNGGTGVSSLALLGAALSSIDLSATWVSAGNITATNVSATTVSATHIISEKGVSSLNVSASNQITGRELLSLGNSYAANASATYVYAEKGVSSTTLSSTYVLASTAVSSNTFTSPGDGGNHFYMKQDSAATYKNLIKAEDGVLTLQAGSNIVLRSGIGEAYAFFRPNGASELYFNNNKTLETHPEGALVIGAVSAITVSSTYMLVEGGVSSTALSATAITGADAMPIPAPFGYVQTDTAGTNSTSMQYFASGADTTNIVSNSDDITWNDTLKVFNVLKAGTYEIRGDLILDSGSQNDIVTLTSRKNNAVVFTMEPRMYGATGPLDISFYNIMVCAALDTITIGIEMGGAKTAHLEAGSTMTVKRLK
jgi:hypothetical protein